MTLAGFAPFCFFNDTATTEIYTLSLHDALPISRLLRDAHALRLDRRRAARGAGRRSRSEEHTSELQSHDNLVCRLLPGKKNDGRPPAFTRCRRRSVPPEALAPRPAPRSRRREGSRRSAISDTGPCPPAVPADPREE